MVVVVAADPKPVKPVVVVVVVAVLPKPVPDALAKPPLLAVPNP